MSLGTPTEYIDWTVATINLLEGCVAQILNEPASPQIIFTTENIYALIRVHGVALLLTVLHLTVIKD